MWLEVVECENDRAVLSNGTRSRRIVYKRLVSKGFRWIRSRDEENAIKSKTRLKKSA